MTKDKLRLVTEAHLRTCQNRKRPVQKLDLHDENMHRDVIILLYLLVYLYFFLKPLHISGRKKRDR